MGEDGERDLWKIPREKVMGILVEHRPEPLDKDVEDKLIKVVREMEEESLKTSRFKA